MIYIRLDYTDGQYYPHRYYTEQEAKEAKAAGSEIVTVREEIWHAWVEHLNQRIVFDTLWLSLDNAQREER